MRLVDLISIQVLQREKERNLSGKQGKDSSPHDHAPGWNEYLASSSEANIKADKAEGTPLQFQKKSVESIKARHHADDVTSGTVEAQYERDEVQGPLRSAMSRAKETVEETVDAVKKKL